MVIIPKTIYVLLIIFRFCIKRYKKKTNKQKTNKTYEYKFCLNSKRQSYHIIQKNSIEHRTYSM